MQHETEIIEIMEEMLGIGYEVKIHDTKKTNGYTRKGVMIIKRENTSLAPIIYIDNLFEDVNMGNITVADAAEIIIRTYLSDCTAERLNKFDILNMGKDEFLQNIIPEAISAELNRVMLSGIPHKELLDIAIIYRCMLDIGSENKGSFIVSNEVCKKWDVTFGELEAAAKRNVMFKYPYNVQTLDDMIREFKLTLPCSQEEKPEMYLITNKVYTYGAAVLDCSDVFDKLANKIRSNLLIIPSSIHEVLVVPESIKNDVYILRQMVKMVNSTSTLRPEEVLSNKIYRYDLDTRKLIIA